MLNIERRYFREPVVIGFFILIATVWLLKSWGPAPYVLTNGDAGNVSSIIAAELAPDRFQADPVFSDPDQFSFYWTISIPLTKWIYHWTQDIGQAYLFWIWPIILIQLLGFYFLGLRLFRDQAWAIILALISLSPIFVFGYGELWGQLDEPLTRSYFSAIFPYLLLFCINDKYKENKWHPYGVMLICSFLVYVHPVSAPSIAFACWMGLFFSEDSELSLSKKIRIYSAAGVLFLLFASPFMLSFFHRFPSSASPEQASAVAIAAQTLRQAAGSYYYNVWEALYLFISKPWGWSWSVWGLGLFGLMQIQNRRFLLSFTIGLLIASVGLVWLDQTIAAHYGRHPVQIDLIRNFRYLIPMLLIGFVQTLKILQSKIPPSKQIVLWLGLLVFGFFWSKSFPTAVIRSFDQMLHRSKSLDSINNADTREVLNRIHQLPSNSRIMAYPQDQSRLESFMLAVRYSSFQPVAHLKKDLNFLTYSGSGNEILKWKTSSGKLNAIDTATDPEKAVLLHRFFEEEGLEYLVVYRPYVSEAFYQGLSSEFELLEGHETILLFRATHRAPKIIKDQST